MPSPDIAGTSLPAIAGVLPRETRQSITRWGHWVSSLAVAGSASPGVARFSSSIVDRFMSPAPPVRPPERLRLESPEDLRLGSLDHHHIGSSGHHGLGGLVSSESAGVVSASPAIADTARARAEAIDIPPDHLRFMKHLRLGWPEYHYPGSLCRTIEGIFRGIITRVRR